MQRYGKSTIGIALFGAALALLSGCKQDGATAKLEAAAQLQDADGNPVGQASFEQVPGGVKLRFDGEGLPPGIHGFHIHEAGDCQAPSFESAGGHFNPTNAQHGLENPKGPHLGDLPNLEVDANGRASVELMIDDVNLEPSGERSLLAGDGTALVIHADADDQVTDPAGDAGPRIACGVIRQR